MASDATMWLSGLTGRNIRTQEERRCGEVLDRLDVNLAIPGKPCVLNLHFWFDRVKTCFFLHLFPSVGQAQNPELSFTPLLHVTLLAFVNSGTFQAALKSFFEDPEQVPNAMPCRRP